MNDTAELARRSELELLNIELELQNEELRHSQVELQRSQQRLERLHQLAPVGYAVVDPDGVVVEANAELARLFQLSREEMLGHPLIAHMESQTAATFQRYLSGVREAQGSVELELQLELENATKFVRIEAITEVEGEGEGTSVWLAFIDQTSIWKAQQVALRTSNRFRTFLERHEDAVFVFNRRTSALEYVNASFEAIFGPLPSPDPDITAAWRYWIHPEDRESAGRALVEYRQGGPFDLDVRLVHPPDQTRWVHARVFPVTEGDTIVGDIGLLRDVTESHIMSSELEHAHRVEMLGTLAASVSHDFNNVVQAIIGTVQLALRSGMPHSSARLLEHALRAARRGGELASQLTSHVRKSPPTPRAAVLLDEHIGPLVELSRRLLSDDDELSFHPGAATACVSATPTELEQILFNLVVNARDAMPGGGHVRIETDLSAGTSNAPARVRLSVVDNGQGMDATTLERACEPFFTTKGNKAGTGLGLATVRRLVDKRGGELSIQSELGRGTRVTVALPCTHPSSRETGPLPRLGVLTGTVLLVDPDPLARASTAAEIEHLGLTVYAASGAADALEWCKRTGTRVDILMTETPLPTMTGCELAEQVGRLKPGVRCLFSTSTDRPALCEEIQTRVLVKPFEHQELVASLAELLSGSNAADDPVGYAAGDALDSPGSAARSVLVVEDYAPTRLAISDALADAGYETVTVANIGEAMRSAQRMPVLDLVLCDVRLPDGDGADLARAVREIHRGARIVLMSGASTPSGPQPAAADAFLSKPFDLDALVSTLQRVLDP